MPHLFSAKMLRKEAHEITGYFMRHKTGFDVAFSWNKDDPNFSEEWERVPAVAQPAPASTEQAGDAWISVEDRLPEDTAVVAIFDPENDAFPVRTALWLAGSCTFESEQGWLAKDEISHWMPLPAAPSPNNSPVGGKD